MVKSCEFENSLKLTYFPYIQIMLLLTHFARSAEKISNISGFHVLSSPPCWWMKPKDLSLACSQTSNRTIVIGISRDWLQITYLQRGMSLWRERLPTSHIFQVQIIDVATENV